jgi:hypothetical protein
MTTHSFVCGDFVGRRGRALRTVARGTVLAALTTALLATGCSVTTNTTTTPPPGGSDCSEDSSVSCSTGMGWSCTGSSQPEDSNSGLVCSNDVGTGQFCCVSSSCNYDATVTGCASGTTGYSCATGDSAPDATDSTLVCSVPTTANGVDEYCCFTNVTTVSATSTCEQDSTVSGCQPDSAGNPSYGFSCTGSESPDTDFSNITCSAMGTSGMDAQGAAATLFCCTYM